MANTRQRWEKGAILYYDAPYRNRIIDAVGPNVTKDIVNCWTTEGEVTASTNTMVYNEWVVTDTDGGTGDLLLAPQGDGTLLITTAANEYDGVSMQKLSASFKLAANSPLYCGARVKISDATQSDLLFGLCSVGDVTLTAASSAHATDVASGCYFSKLDGTTAGYFTNEAATSETSIAAFTATTAWTWLEFFAEGAAPVKAYVNGVYVGANTLTPPTAALGLSFSFRAGTTAAVTCYIDRMYAVQLCARA
jgi:hypothetical protein